MRPSHNPTRVAYESGSVDPAWKERQKLLGDFFNGIHEKAQNIPYSQVTVGISKKISEYLTHPTTLFGDRWKDVMAKLGYTDLCLQAKVKYHEKWDKTAFFLFLTEVFAPKGGTLWQVIEALSEEKYTDVMENIKADVSEFVATYTPVAVNQQSSKSIPPDTMDSGVGQSLSLNGNPSCHNRERNINYLTHVQSPPKNHDFLIGPQKEHVVLDYVESLQNRRQNPQENVFWPKQEEFSNMSFLNGDSEEEEEDDNLDFNFPFLKKSPTSIKVFIPHTDDEEDENVAEEIAGRLEDEYDIKAYLLKNMSCLVNMDVGHFVMKVMDSMDFLVPVLSRAYLQEIVPVGNTSEMSNHRLVLRYIHATSQTRVINKNSLNFLIRPIIVHDVNFGMVRRWHEFQCAVKYPKDLGRLAKNLKATKQILNNNKYRRQ